MNSHALASITPLTPAAIAPDSMLMPAHVAAVVPFEHHEVYSRLSFEQQKRVSLLLQIFQEMATASEGLVACSDRMQATYPGNGFSGSNLRTLYYAFRAAEKQKKGSGWMRLAKIHRGPDKLPAEFVQEVRRRIEANAVSARAAITSLRTDWAEGREIPGYGTWRDYFRATRPLDDVPERFPLNFYPEGWSQSNLYTKQSSKAERALKRQGFAAAKRYLPHVMRDLSLLRFLELIVIDDFETDQLVQAWNPETKRWQICRCAGLLAIDAATRTKLAIGLKPRFTDDEGKKMSLTRADVQTLLYEVFRTHGLPTAYRTTILAENAAAAISGDFELALELLLGVQVARTGLIHEKTLKNGFVQSGGKPWEKPWIESMFRLMHSTAGELPGQKGASYQLKPADLEAKVLYAEKLLNTEGLPPEAALQIRVPFLKVEEFLAAYERIFARMETRHDHKLQGFEERFMYQLPDGRTVADASSLALMAPDQITQCTPLPYKESPRERLARLVAQVELRPVAPHVLACLLLTPKRVKLINHRLSFAHQGRGFTFADGDSPVMQLPEGSEVLGYFDQARPGVLYVTDLKGRYIGPVRARGRVDIRDAEAIGTEQAEVARLIRACVLNPVRDRHAGEDAQLASDREHNQALLAQHGLADTSPAAHSIATRESRGTASTGDKADTGPKTGRQGLSKQLSAPMAPAAADAGTLADGIAEEFTAADDARIRAADIRRQVASLSAEDLQAFGTAPAAPVQPPPAASQDSMTDFL